MYCHRKVTCGDREQGQVRHAEYLSLQGAEAPETQCLLGKGPHLYLQLKGRRGMSFRVGLGSSRARGYGMGDDKRQVQKVPS